MVPAGSHPLIVSRSLISPVLTRIMGVNRRRGGALSPAAEQFYEMLMAGWRAGPSAPRELPAIGGN